MHGRYLHCNAPVVLLAGHCGNVFGPHSTATLPACLPGHGDGGETNSVGRTPKTLMPRPHLLQLGYGMVWSGNAAGGCQIR